MWLMIAGFQHAQNRYDLLQHVKRQDDRSSLAIGNLAPGAALIEVERVRLPRSKGPLDKAPVPTSLQYPDRGLPVSIALLELRGGPRLTARDRGPSFGGQRLPASARRNARPKSHVTTPIATRSQTRKASSGGMYIQL